ncbi:ATP-dependent zinc protease, partial [Candidatus Dojkabacteria bacterium]|nr:ATP-dependent zinc protease [Candidatus Dojkabacteria bacterium]
NNVPVMAMLRIPTKASDGKANLHAGGIGAGIDLASGVTTTSVKRKIPSIVDYDFEQIEETYDLENNLPLRGIKIPFWDEILTMSVKAQIASGLGFSGIDVVIDREKGPMILELNARPGLGIQMVNMAGLRGRLERVDGIKIKSVKHGIRIAKNLFGGEVEEGIEAMSGKQVVNLVERITIFHINPKKLSKKETVNGMLDTGVLTSRLDTALASRLGYLEAIKSFEAENVPNFFESVKDAQEFINKNKDTFESKNGIVRIARIVEGGKIRVRPVVVVKITIAGVQKDIECILSNQKEMLYPILIGRRELKNYLIDPSRTFVK